MVSRALCIFAASLCIGAEADLSGSGSGADNTAPVATGKPTAAPTIEHSDKPQLRNMDGNMLLQVHESKDIMFRVGEAAPVSLSAMIDQIAQTENLVLGREVTENDSNRSTVGELGAIMEANYADDSATISAKLTSLTDTTATLGETMTTAVRAAEESLIYQIAKATMLQSAGNILKVAGNRIGNCEMNTEDELKTYECSSTPGALALYGLNLIPGVVGLYTCGLYKGDNAVEVGAAVSLTQDLSSIKIKSATKVIVTCNFDGTTAAGEGWSLQVREQGNTVPFADESLGLAAMINHPRISIAE